MEGSPWRVLLAAMVLIQLTYADQSYESPPDGKLIFNTPFAFSDWPISEQDTNIVYTENSGSNHVFAFSIYDPSKKTAVIKIATTKDKSETALFQDERCEYDFDVPDGSIVELRDLWLRTHNSSFVLSFLWDIKGENKNNYGNVNSVNCHEAEMKRKSEKTRKKRADLRVIPPGHDKGEDAGTGFRIPEPKKPKDDEATKGKDAIVSKFMSIKRKSLARDKYGVCWTGDKSVTCAQGPLTAETNSSQLVTWGTVKLNEQAGFLGVYNFDENRMLVTVGNCLKNNCDYFDLYEVRPDGKVFKHGHAFNYMGECRNPLDITIGGYYDDVRKQTCFDGVCVAKTSLKYRRVCAIFKK